MKNEIVELNEDLSHSSLYSEDLAPVPVSKRTWSMWHLAAIWVGMAVCIPTYMLAADMIKSGVSWWAALLIIGLANIIITIPMILNGHAGVKYGIPFPVLGRASFGTVGIHLASIVRALVACGWFGIQTWIGGMAIYTIWNVLTGTEPSLGLDAGKFIGFGIFWLINMYFVWKGTESIRWLEEYSAPILILMGLILIGWGASKAGGFGVVLEQSKQLQNPTASYTKVDGKNVFEITPLKDKAGKPKATAYQVMNTDTKKASEWLPISTNKINVPLNQLGLGDAEHLELQMRMPSGNDFIYSGKRNYTLAENVAPTSMLWKYILMLTAMVGFWATMSLSIADITRYAATQKAQVAGQFIGLPGTMILYSFVGIFVTAASLINFPDVMMGEDAPWDPVALLAKFENPVVVVVAQIFMLIATLSTNIAANVIAPANAFSNLLPKQISFRTGGIITGVIGILICPWWLINQIIPILIFVSGLLGPVLGILLSDYYLVRNKQLQLAELFKENGKYSYSGGINMKAIIALAAGVLVALIGYWVPALSFLYSLSWFTGFIVSFILYYVLMGKQER